MTRHGYAKITEEIVDRMITLLARGESITNIAKTIGCHRQTVRKYIVSRQPLWEQIMSSPAATLSVEQAAKVLGIGRVKAYNAVNRGQLPSIRLGRTILIPKAALRKLLGYDKP